MAACVLEFGCSKQSPQSDAAGMNESMMAGGKGNGMRDVSNRPSTRIALFPTPMEFEQMMRDAPDPEFAATAKRMGISVSEVRILRVQWYEEEREMLLLAQSKQGKARVQMRLRAACQALSATSNQIAQDPLVANGSKLPRSFIDMFGPKLSNSQDTPTDLMHRAGFLGAPRECLLDQIVLLSGSMALFPEAPDTVMEIVKERGNTLPPTAADYILFTALTISIPEDVQDLNRNNISGKAIVPEYAAGLLELARAANPIYRWLVLDNLLSLERDQSKRIAVLATFSNETDPLMRNGVIKGLQSMKTPEADKALKAFEGKK